MVTELTEPRYPGGETLALFFAPIHQLDRAIRPGMWFETPMPEISPEGDPDKEDAIWHDPNWREHASGKLFRPIKHVSAEPSPDSDINSLADGLRRLPDVAAVTIHGNTSNPAGTIIHIRNWHYLPLELFAADILAQSDEDIETEEIERVYGEFLDEVEAVQKQQLPVLEWLAKQGQAEIWVEGLTDDSIRLYEKYASDYHKLWSKVRTTRLELGAPGRMLADGKMKVLAFDEKQAMDAAEPDAVTAEFTEEDNARREEAMVCRIVSAGRPVNVVMLGGAHDLRDGLRRLRCEGWSVVTVDVRAYRTVAEHESDDGGMRDSP